MPVSPYPSCREPTRYVMFTVVCGFDLSGKSRTRSPLGSRYSVMPSTLTPFTRDEPAFWVCATADDELSTTTPATAMSVRKAGEQDITTSGKGALRRLLGRSAQCKGYRVCPPGTRSDEGSALGGQKQILRCAQDDGSAISSRSAFGRVHVFRLFARALLRARRS